MLQTVIQLFALSRTTSYSTSFHPLRDFSTRICDVRDNERAARECNSSASFAKPDPRPPREYAERMMTGYPISAAAVRASSTVPTAVDWAIGMLISEVSTFVI